MKIKKRIVLFLLIIVSPHLWSQIVEDDYYNFLKNKKINKTYSLKDKELGAIQKITFLGEVTNKKFSTYKVLVSHTNFSGKGVNNLIFISKKGEVYIYSLDLPSDMPSYISFNRLYFVEEKTKKVKTMVIEELTPIFCTPFGCFNKIN